MFLYLRMRQVQSLQCLQYFFYAFAMLLQYFYNTSTFTIFDVVYTLYFEAIWNNVVLLKAISKTLLMNSLSIESKTCYVAYQKIKVQHYVLPFPAGRDLYSGGRH